MNLPSFSAHPFRAKMLEKGITLSMLREAMPGRKLSESRLSFFLTGKRVMPMRIEQAIREALAKMGVIV